MSKSNAAFDTVGKYNQDQINGFSESFLERFVSMLQPESSKSILDLMGGDGNLTARIAQYCEAKGLKKKPKLTLLEYSRVQCEFARMNLGADVEVIWGDALQMQALDSGAKVPVGSFDKIVIKSANHEIPADRQRQLYERVFESLEPGGLFFNLGMLFDSAEERDELAEIGRCKDRLAGMTDAVMNRHWLTKSELYQTLGEVGFVDLQGAASFDYQIFSEHVSRFYFAHERRDSFDLEFQATQARARHLRRAGRLTFTLDSSLMRCPGEITIARKPYHHERNSTIFTDYPYDIVRHIKVHRELLDHAREYIPFSANVIDIGCGIGLLAERVLDSVQSYHGIDLASDFIQLCKERFNGRKGCSFEVADMNEFEIPAHTVDVVTLINSIYVEGVKPEALLEKVYEGLRDGGVAIISGPLSRESYKNSEPRIREQLLRDHQCSSELLDEIRTANEKLLSAQANYFSVEALVELLRRVGFEEFPVATHEHFYGNAYFIVARK